MPAIQVRSEQQRVKEEAEKKLQRYIRQLDHFERARRDEEAPLIEAAHRKQVRKPLKRLLSHSSCSRTMLKRRISSLRYGS